MHNTSKALCFVSSKLSASAGLVCSGSSLEESRAPYHPTITDAGLLSFSYCLFELSCLSHCLHSSLEAVKEHQFLEVFMYDAAVILLL